MNAAAAPASKSVMFQDPLGERRHIADASGADTLELLCLRSDLTSVPSFEFALRERVSRLANFRHAYYGRVRSVDRLNDGSTLALVSDRVPGVRLSQLLDVAEQRHLTLDINTALSLIRQLVPAVALLHEHARDVAHGALGPERLVITPNARLVIVEHVLGAALEQLRFSQERYWNELRIPMPRSTGLPRFDHRADVMQLGVVALSLVLGRTLQLNEYPAHVGDVVASAWAISARGGLEPLPSGLRSWLTRALQLDPRNSFPSAVEARAELDRMFGDSDYIVAPHALESFLAQYQDVRVLEEAPAPAPAKKAEEARVDAPVPQITDSPWAGTPSADPTNADAPIFEVPTIDAPRFDRPMAELLDADLQNADGPVIQSLAESTVTRRPLFESAKPSKPEEPLFERSSFELPQPAKPVEEPVFERSAYEPATLPTPVEPPAVERFGFEPANYSKPADAPVVDRFGFEPVKSPRLAETPVMERPHFEPAESFPVEFSTADDEDGGDEMPGYRPTRRTPKWPRIAAGGAVLIALAVGGAIAGRHYFVATATAPATGTLNISTDPPGAQLTVDGVLQGVTPINLTLQAGPHALELRAGSESRSIPVTIVSGTQASQYIELSKVTATGQLQVRSEPAGALVTVDGVARGKAPVTIGELTPGMHIVSLENESGSIKQEVSVEAGATASLVVPLAASQGASLSGWVSVTAPVTMQLFEGGRLLGSTESERIMVSAGRHEIEVTNQPLAYRAVHTVQVVAGRVAPIKIELPKQKIAVNAVPWAEVWIDGEKIGDTPLGDLSVVVGPHEIVFRHPQLGEQRHAITVTAAAPARLSVDMRKP